VRPGRGGVEIEQTSVRLDRGMGYRGLVEQGFLFHA